MTFLLPFFFPLEALDVFVTESEEPPIWISTMDADTSLVGGSSTLLSYESIADTRIVGDLSDILDILDIFTHSQIFNFYFKID